VIASALHRAAGTPTVHKDSRALHDSVIATRGQQDRRCENSTEFTPYAGLDREMPVVGIDLALGPLATGNNPCHIQLRSGSDQS
jgi:hypothetical protein